MVRFRSPAKNNVRGGGLLIVFATLVLYCSRYEKMGMATPARRATRTKKEESLLEVLP